MNTILHKQIFSPIPFSEYHPDVAYQTQERPQELDINKKYGHYDSSNYQQISFYLKDYIAGDVKFSIHEKSTNSAYITARSHFEDRIPIVRQDKDIPLIDQETRVPSILSLFIESSSDIHVLRAVEPSLRLWHGHKTCQPILGPQQYLECQVSRANGLGTRAQLASLILQYSELKSR